MTGKSEFVKASAAVSGPGTVLTVDCMSVLDPDLRDFREGEDSCILWRGQRDMVQRSRHLFQAPMHDIKINESQTGCYCYAVNFWRVKLVITSKSLRQQLDALAPEDAEWVRRNTRILEVAQPMWP